MNVELAVLTDYATTTADGKLIVAGVFDAILEVLRRKGISIDE